MVLLRRHSLFLVLLILGAAYRVIVAIAYPPALFFSDSWTYILYAFSGHFASFFPVGLPNIRPAAYPLLVWLLSLPDRSMTELVSLQHLAGLLIGAGVYAALDRAALPRPLAVAAAALVLLDGYAITLEQYVMADTLFAATLLLATLLLAWPVLPIGRDASVGPRRSVLTGLLLASGVLERVEGLFLIPVVLIYLLWRRTRLVALVAWALAVALPLLAYAAAIDGRYGTFGLTQSDGWTLYGRVAGFADCAGVNLPTVTRPLCETATERRSHPDAPTWYIFSGASPAVREFGPEGRTVPGQRRSDRLLGTFARRIIEHQPAAYLRAVASDALRYFTPGATAFDDRISATSLPMQAADEYSVAAVRRRYVPGVHPRVRAPAGLARALRSVIHVPRPVLAALAIVSIVALVLRTRARREILLLSGCGLALLLGTAATAGFGLRYLLAAVPLLGVGGGLALRDLLPW